jgi:hypothetical protein
MIDHRPCLLFVFASIAAPSFPLLADEVWPPSALVGAWRVTSSSVNGKPVDEAKDNMVIFHGKRMVFATDRNYAPPNPEVCAIGYDFYAIDTSGQHTVGLVRVQRGKLKFMLDCTDSDGSEAIEVRIEDYSDNRLTEVVKLSAVRMDGSEASKRIKAMLHNPKLKASADFRETLASWLKSQESGGPGNETKSP